MRAGRRGAVARNVAPQLGNRYDLIFCDPPTFSNSKRMRDTWDVQRDHVGADHGCGRDFSPRTAHSSSRAIGASSRSTPRRSRRPGSRPMTSRDARFPRTSNERRGYTPAGPSGGRRGHDERAATSSPRRLAQGPAVVEDVISAASDDNVPMMAAAISYYLLLTIAPLRARRVPCRCESWQGARSGSFGRSVINLGAFLPAPPPSP